MQLKPIIALCAAGAIAAGCSSSTKTSAKPRPSSRVTTTTRAPGGPYTRPACTTKQPAPVVATRVAGSNSDFNIRSFDGTSIRVHWFPRPQAGGSRAPTVLKGPGWGQPGDVNVAGSGYGLFGDLGIGALNTAGYNVLTWDPRGFGQSTGTVESDSPAFEGRDVQRLIDWVSEQPGVQLDQPGDPRVGMVGASYGGGIQLVTAAIDCRVDAIVPQIAWHSLGTSLYKANIPKRGWGDLLYAAAASRSLDPHITSAHEASDTTGVIKEADSQWFLDRGPGDLVRKITAPTLIEQGTIDTLFTLDEAAANYAVLHANGVPVGLIWMCSGHGVCLTNPGNQALPGTAAIAWLNRYVKRDPSVSVGAPFEYVDQNGTELTAGEYPPPSSTSISARGNGHLTLIADGGSGPAKATGTLGALGSFALPITPAEASHAVNVPITVASAAKIVGAPQLTIRYSGSTPAGAGPTRAFAQLVDNSTGLVLGNQITPIPVTLDGRAHTSTVPLEMVAFTAKPGSRLTLQIVATTIAYTRPRLGGAISFDSVAIALPTVAGVTPVAR